LDIDAGYSFIDNDKLFSQSGEKDQHLLQLRGVLGFELFENFKFFGGTGIGYIFDNKGRHHHNDCNTSADKHKDKFIPLFFGGFELTL
jgi:hypothetical protein